MSSSAGQPVCYRANLRGPLECRDLLLGRLRDRTLDLNDPSAHARGLDPKPATPRFAPREAPRAAGKSRPTGSCNSEVGDLGTCCSLRSQRNLPAALGASRVAKRGVAGFGSRPRAWADGYTFLGSASGAVDGLRPMRWRAVVPDSPRQASPPPQPSRLWLFGRLNPKCDRGGGRGKSRGATRTLRSRHRFVTCPAELDIRGGYSRFRHGTSNRPAVGLRCHDGMQG